MPGRAGHSFEAPGTMSPTSPVSSLLCLWKPPPPQPGELSAVLGVLHSLPSPSACQASLLRLTQRGPPKANSAERVTQRIANTAHRGVTEFLSQHPAMQLSESLFTLRPRLSISSPSLTEGPSLYLPAGGLQKDLHSPTAFTT